MNCIAALYPHCYRGAQSSEHALAIPRRLEQIDEYLSSPDFDSPPDFDVFYCERQGLYAGLGQEVAKIAQHFRHTCALPMEPKGAGGRSRHELLAEATERYANYKAVRERNQRELMSALSKVGQDIT